MDQSAGTPAASVQAFAAPIMEAPVRLIQRTRRLAILLLFLTVLSMIFGNFGIVSIASVVVLILGFRSTKTYNRPWLNAFACMNSCMAVFGVLAFVVLLIVAVPTISCSCSASCVSAAYQFVQDGRGWALNVTTNSTDSPMYRQMLGIPAEEMPVGVNTGIVPPHLRHGVPADEIIQHHDTDAHPSIGQHNTVDDAPACGHAMVGNRLGWLAGQVGLGHHLHEFLLRAHRQHGNAMTNTHAKVESQVENDKPADKYGRPHPLGGLRGILGFWLHEMALAHGGGPRRARPPIIAVVDNEDAYTAPPQDNNELMMKSMGHGEEEKEEEPFNKDVPRGLVPLRRMGGMRNLLSLDDFSGEAAPENMLMTEATDGGDHEFTRLAYSQGRDGDSKYDRKYLETHKYYADDDEVEEFDDDDDDDEPADIGQAVLLAYAEWAGKLTLPQFQRTASRVCRSGPGITAGAAMFIFAMVVLHAMAASVARKLANHPWFMHQDALRRTMVSTRRPLPPVLRAVVGPQDSNTTSNALPSAPNAQADVNALYRFVPGEGFVQVNVNQSLPATVPVQQRDFVDNIATALSSAVRGGRDLIGQFARSRQGYAPVTSAVDDMAPSPGNQPQNVANVAQMPVAQVVGQHYATPTYASVPSTNPYSGHHGLMQVVSHQVVSPGPQMFGPAPPQGPPPGSAASYH